MALNQNWTKKESHLNWSIHIWSHPQLCDAAYTINLTATAAMEGGTQLVEGAHLTGGNTRFCCESSKGRNYSPFVGDIIKYEKKRIISGFGSNVPPLNKNLPLMCPFKFLGFKSNYLDLRTFVAN